MPPPKYVRQIDIAKEANVHVTTVSLALRNDPRLSAETRDNIHRIAQRMGYHPDPMLTALTVHRNLSKRKRHQGTIAWVCPCLKENIEKTAFSQFLQGARQRCDELGYVLEQFFLPEIGGQRLHGILQTRNIKGLLIPPQEHSHFHLDFEWDEYAAVCIGFTLGWPKLHLICNAQYSSVRFATKVVRTRGYRRLGFITSRETDQRTNQNFLAGFLSEQQRFKPAECIPPLVFHDTTIPEQSELIGKWYRQNEPDAIIFHYNTVPELLEVQGITSNDCGLASLSLKNRDGELAGMYQNDLLVGEKAVDVVVDMLHRNERGIPRNRFQFFVEGEWVEGRTIRCL